MTEEQIQEVEKIVNAKIQENIVSDIEFLPIEQAKKKGAMALFGEKYEDVVRVVVFDAQYSIELCGGTHVKNTGSIGVFKIISEEAISSGIRRIEAYTGMSAFNFLNQKYQSIKHIGDLLKAQKGIEQKVEQMIEENKELKKHLQSIQKEQGQLIKKELKQKITSVNDINLLVAQVNFESPDEIKNILFELNNEVSNFIGLIGNTNQEKCYLSLIVNQTLTDKINASQLIREGAKHIKGGGGGQANFAQAGGSDKSGLQAALSETEKIIRLKI